MQQKQPHDWWKTFRKWLKTAWDTVKKFLIQVYPGRKVWLGAGLGIGITGYLFLILMAVDVFLPAGWGYFLLILILMPLVVSLVAAILIGLGRVLFRLPAVFLILLATGVVLMVISFSISIWPGTFLGCCHYFRGLIRGSSVGSHQGTLGTVTTPA